MNAVAGKNKAATLRMKTLVLPMTRDKNGLNPREVTGILAIMNALAGKGVVQNKGDFGPTITMTVNVIAVREDMTLNLTAHNGPVSLNTTAIGLNPGSSSSTGKPIEARNKVLDHGASNRGNFQETTGIGGVFTIPGAQNTRGGVGVKMSREGIVRPKVNRNGTGGVNQCENQNAGAWRSTTETNNSSTQGARRVIAKSLDSTATTATRNQETSRGEGTGRSPNMDMTSSVNQALGGSGLRNVTAVSGERGWPSEEESANVRTIRNGCRNTKGPIGAAKQIANWRAFGKSTVLIIQTGAK